MILIPPQREQFDIPGEVAYFNCAYMGPLPRASSLAGEAGARRKSHPWTVAPRDFFSDAETARGLFASIVGAQGDDIAIVPSASYGIAVAMNNLPVEPDRHVVLLTEQFPSNVYAWQALAQREEARITSVARPADGEWTPAVLDVIDDACAVVALPHCHWTDGSLIDLVAVGERCRSVGAALVVDLTQSAGALPFDVTAVQPDFAVAAAYKWLLGPYAFGFLYVAPRWQDGEPLEHNWANRAGSEDFRGLVDYRDEFEPGARRFDMGERASFHTLPVAIASLRQLHDWEVPRIASTLAARTAEIGARAAGMGLEPTPSEQRAGHFLGIRFPGGVPEGLAATLAAKQVYVSIRGDAMRVTPHLYNTDADVDRLLDALRAAIR